MLKDLLEYGHAVRAVDLARGHVPLHAMAISAGYEQRANEVYSWDGRRRGNAPFLVVQHTLSGRGRLDFAGADFALTRGQTMVLAMPHAHRYWLEPGQTWEYFWIVLNGREALRLARDIIDANGPVISPSQAVIDRMAAACLSLISRPELQPGEVSSLAYTTMMALHDAVFAGRQPVSPELPPAIARVVAYVEEDVTRPMHVERLAAIAQMSRSHFVRQFSAATGLGPAAFVFSARIERVQRLLLATDLSVGDIAAATGFANANYLAKSFRRAEGKSPLEYRRFMREHVGA
ncbi:AraC family transcriptional regulator [Devosia pacifica]|uniref:AraC family transcriptional regulator n=1 Tax=Devosia pacifica TaxID=1335967 RepID=A0A918VYF3_9HYPH|nr:AraC family transcriptional regulator [Devosia pacifica]GHA34478.1 AraC family transcriptional regulator [Devosia pacifica]